MQTMGSPTNDRFRNIWFIVGSTNGCGFSAYSWKLPAYSGASLLTVDNFSFFAYNWSFFAYNFSFLTHNWSFFAYSWKARLIRALRDCKQRSLTVSKKAPTVSKKASPGSKWRRLVLDASFYLQLRSFFAYGSSFYLRWGNCEKKRPNPNSGRREP